MLTLNKERARKILVSELGMDPLDVATFLEDYPPIHEDLAPAVERWLSDRTVLDVGVGGVTISQVMHARPTHFLMAVLLLNSILGKDIPPEDRPGLARNLLRRLIVR